MQVDIEKGEGLKRVVYMTISKPEVDEAFETFLSEAQKTAQLPGFRKGNAPKHLVKVQLGEMLSAEVSTRLVYTAIQELVRDGDMRLAGVPVVIKEHRPTAKRKYIGLFNVEGSFTFAVDVDAEPELDVKNYTGIEINSQPIEVDKWMDIALDDIRSQFVSLETADRPAQDGDQLMLELEPDGELRTVILGNKDVEPELNAVLLGKSSDDTFELPELRGKIYSVDARELPELNDELAQLAGFEDLAALTGELATRADAEYVRPAKANIMEEITNVLFENNPFEVPDVWITYEMQVVAARMGLQKMPEDEQSLATLKELAERSVRRSFILDKIYQKEENIHMSIDEIYAILDTDAQRLGHNTEEYLTSLKNTNRYEAYVSHHEQNKAVDFLIDNVVIREKK